MPLPMGNEPPRRLIDSRYDFNPVRGSIADEAERIIILRLMDGISPHYLRMMALKWQTDLAPSELGDGAIALWYNAIAEWTKSPILLSQAKFKADFYRQTWESMSAANRNDMTRDEWVTIHINKLPLKENNRLQQGLEPSNIQVSQELRGKYAEYGKRAVREDAYKRAAKNTYFMVTQPEAYEQMQNQIAEKNLVEEAERKAKLEEAEKAEEKEENEMGKPVFRGLQAEVVVNRRKRPVVW